MPPILPISLAPHVVVHTSSDVDDLLASRSLPPLHELLHSFTPLPQVSTRTTGLSPVQHSNFNLRFSALSDIEAACREDEERRAGRTIDWIGSRVGRQAASWLEDPESRDQEKWWDDIKSCVQGDRTPVRSEGWNHPLALILAASTLAPNPLQAITVLHARVPDFPPWVDTTMYRYTVIVHPSPSNLNPDEAVALLNAVKKQFGLNTHLLQLPSLRETTTISMPPYLPQLPSSETSRPYTPSRPGKAMSLAMSEMDAQNISRFVREFVTMSLVPWMERCVTEWNESFSSSRRLPTRLFSSTTRRFFGTPSPSPTPMSTIASASTNSSGTNGFASWQYRRLAEFATILGDYKLATAVWDSLRKESQSGTDVLPLLLAPSTSLASYAGASLAALGLSEPGVPASAQLRAMVYAIRWEVGIQNFTEIQGERWLAWAAGLAEEPSSALLLARAASISFHRGARRRAALWFAIAARRLEKSGIKPLTIYFLERANEALSFSKESSLSPSFYDIEGSMSHTGFDGIKPFLNHSMGRLKYSSGDTAGAVRLFSGLLRSPSTADNILESDKMFLEDFHVAFQHLMSTKADDRSLDDLDLPLRFCRPSHTRVRHEIESCTDLAEWAGVEDYWSKFSKARGDQAHLDTRQSAQVREPFWVDLSLINPIEADVTLTDLTVKADSLASDLPITEVATIETIGTVLLRPKEHLTISIRVVPHLQTTIRFTHASYTFLSLLPTVESLALPGKRLNDTAAQRQSKVHADKVFLQTPVRKRLGKLDVHFDDGLHLEDDAIGVFAGEIRREVLKIMNSGSSDASDLWLLFPPDGSICIEDKSEASAVNGRIQTTESLDRPAPHHLENVTLQPGQTFEFPVLFRHQGNGPVTLSMLVVFRESEDAGTFYASRAQRITWVEPLLALNTSILPNISLEFPYIIMLEVENVGGINDVKVAQIGAISPVWSLASEELLNNRGLERLPHLQSIRTFVKVNLASNFDPDASIKPIEDLASALTVAVNGRTHNKPRSETNTVLCASLVPEEGGQLSTSHLHFARSSRRTRLLQMLGAQFPSIPSTDYPSIFPLYAMQDVDLIILWEMPSEHRSGICVITDLVVGPRHGTLQGVLAGAEHGGGGRTMYAETTRERDALLESIRTCHWNADDDPIHVYVEGARHITHDFGNGPCMIPIKFVVRNYSLSLACRFTLRLQSSSEAPIRYIGNMTRHGLIAPSSQEIVHAKALVLGPGLYQVPGCKLEVEVGKERERWERFDQEIGGRCTVEVSSSLEPQLI